MAMTESRRSWFQLRPAFFALAWGVLLIIGIGGMALDYAQTGRVQPGTAAPTALILLLGALHFKRR